MTELHRSTVDSTGAFVAAGQVAQANGIGGVVWGTPSGGSSIWFNVVTYGATGDGTTDDSTAIDDAITAASVDGGIVYFPPGTYLVTATIVVNADGVSLLGDGTKASIILADPALDAGDVIEFDTCNGGGVTGLHITSASVKSAGAGILLTDSVRMHIERVLTSNQFDSIHIVDCTIVRITDCDLYNQDRHGIFIDCDAGNDFYLTGIVADNTPDSGGAGIAVTGGDAIFLSNCDFLHFANGLVIQPTAGRHSEWHFFTGATFDFCSNAGIYIGGDDGDVHGITFVNSWASSNDSNGVVIAGGTGDLEGIEIGDSRFLSNGENGLRIEAPATRITIADSQIAGNSVASSGTHDGISVGAGVLHLTIMGNQAHNDIGSGTQGYGLHFDSGATDYLTIDGNDFSGNATGTIENLAGVTGTHRWQGGSASDTGWSSTTFWRGDGTWASPGSGNYSSAVPWSSGTSMPGSPATNQRVTRTDLGLDFYYDGTRWLCVCPHFTQFGVGNTLAPDTVGTAWGRIAPPSALDLWLIAWEVNTYVATTNNGTNFWTVNLDKFDAADAGTNIDNFTTSADAANAWVKRRRTIGAVFAQGSFTGLRVVSGKTLTPGAAYFSGPGIEFRLIGT